MQKKIKRYVKQDRGKGDYVIENYDRYDTDEIIIEKGEISDVFWVEPYINWFNYENKIFFICSKNILIEYKKNDIEGIRYLGQTSAFSALENCLAVAGVVRATTPISSDPKPSGLHSRPG